jgi:hypothetical protein
MLIIRDTQMRAFEESVRERFEDEMLRHGREFSPRLTTVLGDERSRMAIRSAIDRARGHQFTLRGPVRLFIELSFLFGSAFDTDPQYPWAQELLSSARPEMDRAQALHAKTLEYQDKVSGAGGRNTRRALVELAELATRPVPLTAETLGETIRAEMTRAFPQKAAYIGDDALDALIAKGRGVAAGLQFPARGEAVVVALMFAFGSGCVSDPLYPWIAETLGDPRITTPELRADRLERKSRVWLQHVVDSFSDSPVP